MRSTIVRNLSLGGGFVLGVLSCLWNATRGSSVAFSFTMPPGLLFGMVGSWMMSRIEKIMVVVEEYRYNTCLLLDIIVSDPSFFVMLVLMIVWPFPFSGCSFSATS